MDSSNITVDVIAIPGNLAKFTFTCGGLVTTITTWMRAHGINHYHAIVEGKDFEYVIDELIFCRTGDVTTFKICGDLDTVIQVPSDTCHESLKKWLFFEGDLKESQPEEDDIPPSTSPDTEITVHTHFEAFLLKLAHMRESRKGWSVGEEVPFPLAFTDEQFRVAYFEVLDKLRVYRDLVVGDITEALAWNPDFLKKEEYISNCEFNYVIMKNFASDSPYIIVYDSAVTDFLIAKGFQF